MQLSTFLITVFSLHVVIFTRLWVKKRDSYYGLIVITFALLVLTQVLILTASELSLGNVPVYWFLRVLAWEAALVTLFRTLRRRSRRSAES